MLKRDFKQRVKLPFIDGCSSCWGRCMCVCVVAEGGARASSEQQCYLFDV